MVKNDEEMDRKTLLSIQERWNVKIFGGDHSYVVGIIPPHPSVGHKVNVSGDI